MEFDLNPPDLDKLDKIKSADILFTILLDIMRTLRSPDGCIWDREQDHETLKKSLIEETYETIEAIEKGDPPGIREELGDLILQVVFHSQIADENGHFNMSDVLKGIIKKLLRRHPHVFGDSDASCTGEILSNWEDIKKKERKDNNKDKDSIFSGIPLSQLYQLRGRVGRSSEQAYAYFFYPNQRNLSTTAFQRLKTLSEYTDLGSGYNVAMKDLEIRGAGEILGPRQHGHINSVGFDMYCQIIKEETGKLKGYAIPEDLNIQIDLPVSAYIPRNYIKSQKTRVNIYRELGMAESFEKIEDIKKNLEKKYGTIPLVVMDLLGISKIKYLLANAGIERLKYSKGKGIVIKSIACDEEKFKKIKNGNANIFYQPQFKQITIKNMDKKIDLDLVIEYLSDIIGAM